MQLDALLVILPLLGLVAAAPAPRDSIRKVPRKRAGSCAVKGEHHGHRNSTAAVTASVSASSSAGGGSVDAATSMAADSASAATAVAASIGAASSGTTAGLTSTSVPVNVASVAASSAKSSASAATNATSTADGTGLVDLGMHHHSASSAGTAAVAATSAPSATASSVALHSASGVVSSSAGAAASALASVSSKAAATSSQTTAAAATKSVTVSSAAAAAASASASATGSTSSSSSSSSAAVGLGWNSDSGTDMSAWLSVAGSKFKWYYNWASTASSGASTSVEFVPMVWGTGSVDGVASDEADWPSGTDYILSFNEPNQPTSVGGSDIVASTAATLHQQWTASLTGSYQIGAPAVSFGGESWLSDWVTACAGNCQYDFIPLHVYTTDADALTAYAAQMYQEFGKPIWFTEMACQDYSSGAICTAAEVKTFMDTVVSFFEQNSYIERWAWFGAFETEAAGSATVSANPNGIEDTSGAPNTLGEYYIALK